MSLKNFHKFNEFADYLRSDITHDISLKYFGIIMSINYPLYYLLWSFLSPPGEVHPFEFRLVATLLCIPLIFAKSWSHKIKRYSRPYWLITLIICLPFFFAYETLMNGVTTLWLANTMSAMFFALLILNFIEALAVIFIGIAVAVIVYFTQYGALDITWHDSISITLTLLPAFVIGGIFSFSRQKILNIERNAMYLASSSMAHEIVSPLHRIKLLAEMINRQLKNKKLTDDKVGVISEYVAKTIKSVDQAGAFIQLAMHNVNPNKISGVELKPINLGSAITDIVDSFLEKNERVTINVDTETLPIAGQIMTHEALLQQLLFNLLSNAQHYLIQQGHGEISIWFDCYKDNIRLHVRDNGPGIPAYQLPNIFRDFLTYREGGTGIGLPVCKAIMDKHQGSIKCISEEGAYTHFIMLFPKQITRIKK